MFITDAHLDIAYNAVRGRDVLQPAAKQTADDQGIPTVGLPDLRDGDVRLVGATLFAQPLGAEHPGYTTADEAHAQAQQQIRWYLQQAEDDNFNLITTPATLPAADEEPFSPAQNAIIIMEGADPIRTPEETALWFNMGVRIVGLAWKKTRYAGGTGNPGPLTDEGLRLVKALDELHIIHDASHLAEDSFWHLAELSTGPLIATHSNCRAIVPTDRQLSDEMIREIIDRGGVIGINFFDKFLLPPADQGKRRANLQDVIAHIRHICKIAGNTDHVGLGTDMDGGLGRNEIPHEITSSADLPTLADALADAHFSSDDIDKIMGLNWLNFFRRALPGAQ